MIEESSGLTFVLTQDIDLIFFANGLLKEASEVNFVLRYSWSCHVCLVLQLLPLSNENNEFAIGRAIKEQPTKEFL